MVQRALYKIVVRPSENPPITSSRLVSSMPTLYLFFKGRRKLRRLRTMVCKLELDKKPFSPSFSTPKVRACVQEPKCKFEGWKVLLGSHTATIERLSANVTARQSWDVLQRHRLAAHQQTLGSRDTTSPLAVSHSLFSVSAQAARVRINTRSNSWLRTVPITFSLV